MKHSSYFIRSCQMLALVIFFSLSTTLVYTQDTPNTKIGIFGHYLLSIHSADFSNLPGIPNCCPRFESGSGSGYTFGGLLEVPISNKFLLGARVGIQSIGATLKADEGTTIIVDGVARRGTFTHSVESSLSNIGIDGLFIWNPVKKLYFSTGLRFGMVSSSTFAQEERITTPANGATFLDSNGNDSRQRVRNVFSGEIPQANGTYMGMLLGMAYEFPLNKSKSLLISPELFYQIGLTSVASEMNWNANGLRAGLALKYEFTSSKPTLKNTIVVRDTVSVQTNNEVQTIVLKSTTSSKKVDETPTNIVETETVTETYELRLPKQLANTKTTSSQLSATLTAVGLNDKGQEQQIQEVQIEEFESKVIHPLLPNVFFKEGSSEIQSKYKKLSPNQVSSYTISAKEQSTIDVYYDILNIVGSRLKQNPKATITLTGCNSNNGVEEGNTSLSLQRANAVKDYFVSTWGIAPNQITVESKNLPAKPSNITLQDGIEENRRVEISTSSADILAVVISKDAFRKVTPEIIRLKPTVQTSETLKEVVLSTGGKQITTSQKANTYDYNIARSQNIVNELSKTIPFELQASTTTDKSTTATTSLNVKFTSLKNKRDNNRNDKEIDIYKLLLFDFNSSSLGEYNNTIAKLIKSNIKNNSTITITGYTDRIGDDALNKKLSFDRANEAKKVLNVQNVITNGLGEEVLLFDNNTPEGRMYSRTVEVIVETPLK
ncbi:MAG: OmpA family protein [Candidatus Kapabacteria bacterium]|nr:OmpA family protein [Candidatus Kapabacteria bacterium]